MAKRKETAATEAATADNAGADPALFPTTPTPKLELPKAATLATADPIPEATEILPELPVPEPEPQPTPFAPSATMVASTKVSLRRRNRFALLAACITLAAGIGSIMGAVVGVTLARARQDAPSAMQRINDTATESLQQLRADVSALKASIENNSKTANAQLSKLADRLDKSDKAQSEPAAKIARMAEAIDRLDKKANGPDITGSIIEKQPARPAVVDGWVLRDIYRGRALLENRAGLFEVAPGSNLPGVGRVETIKREDGRWVVVTPKGLIVSGR